MYPRNSNYVRNEDSILKISSLLLEIREEKQMLQLQSLSLNKCCKGPCSLQDFSAC